MYEETVAGLRKIVNDHRGRLTPFMRVTICEAIEAIKKLSRRAEEWEVIAESWQKSCKGLESRIPRWVSVAERLPEQGRQYLVLRVMESGETVIETLWHDGEKLWWNRLYEPCGKITHWMPLPETPKEG